MTRFVYVLPAGRFRWEVRVDTAPLIEAAAEAMWTHDGYHFEPGTGNIAQAYRNTARAVIETALPEPSQFYRLKRDALIAARAIAIVIGGEVQPHDRRGRIQDPDSYGGDSPRRRG